MERYQVEPVFHVMFGPTFESDRYRIGAVVRGREAWLEIARVFAHACFARVAGQHIYVLGRVPAMCGQVSLTVLAGQLDQATMTLAYSELRT